MALTSAVPFCVIQLFLVLLIGYMAWASLRGLREVRTGKLSIWRLLGRGLRFLVAGAALAQALLLLVWGLNLFRPPLRKLMNWEVPLSSADELVALGQDLAREAAQLRPEGPVDWTQDVRPGFAALDRAWIPEHLPRAKAPMAGRFFRHFSCTGVYGVWTAEPLVDGGAPGWYQPSLRAHETAHGAGFVREDEANYLAWTACRAHPRVEIRYAGTLAALYEVRGRLARSGRLREVDGLLSEGCRQDIRALIKFFERPAPTAKVSSKIYNQVLKVQGQSAGLESYGLAVDLMLAERRSARGSFNSVVDPAK
jgi:hypothetical protein